MFYNTIPLYRQGHQIGGDVSDHQSSDSSAHYQGHAMPGLLHQQPKPEGLDMQRPSDHYSAMMPQSRAHLPSQGVADRRSSSNQGYPSYDHVASHPSPYANPGSNSSSSANLGASSALSQMSKAAVNSPPQTWTPRHLQRVSEQ